MFVAKSETGVDLIRCWDSDDHHHITIKPTNKKDGMDSIKSCFGNVELSLG